MLRHRLVLAGVALLLVGTSLAVAQDRRGRGRGRGRPDAKPSLKVGQTAPTFELKSLDGKSATDLASFKGKRPVILFFGSYT